MFDKIKRVMRCAGKAVLPKVPKWIAKAAGLDLLADMCEVGDDFYKAWVGEASEGQARAELAEVARPIPAEQLKQIVAQVVAELAPQASPEMKQGLSQYLMQIPGATRQALKRPADPSGTTVPATLAFKGPADVLALLPVGLAQFQPGERPSCLHGDWELVELLGRGGQGEVWKAHRIDDASFVAAFKFCTDPDAKRQLQLNHERAIIGRVRLANVKGVVTLQNYKLDSSPPWLQYELIEGGDLAGMVNEWNEQPGVDRVPTALAIWQNLAMIVGQFHRLPEPILHRDLKPANILVRRLAKKLHLLIADFGIGHIAAKKQLDQSRIATAMPKSLGTLRYACTPLYASPQQQRGEDPDPRDDVFALGVIGYQLLLRDLSRSAPTGWGWDKRLRALGLADGHVQLLGECMAQDVDDRPKDAQELHERIVKLARMPDGERSEPSGSPTREPDPPTVIPVARVAPAQSSSTRKPGDIVTNQLGMKFAWIPPDTFTMGSPPGEKDRFDDETPHRVTIAKGFHLGIHQVTQAQWQAVMGNSPSHFKGDDLPVERVSWNDACAFCKKLGAKDGHTYRLPTEAEWEYACRAGSQTAYCFGDNPGVLGPYAWFSENSGSKTHPVGQKHANDWGLYDMHGNVWEWCADFYGEYPSKPVTDPTGPATGSEHLLRGGSWHIHPLILRSADRRRNEPTLLYNDVGFRVCSCLD
ncbi:MAG: SUMF1/EgtB/PvdO family nonheme iron enzyme [Planctomycetes bacterium]|nr:SUMF1/EgtB/PvdO family nonheme iron enzyme [Planctomycetota bacterium]